jgi:type I restriction enzyme S subunit
MSALPDGWAACGIGDLVKQIEKGQPQSDFTYIDISSIDNKTKKILEPNLVEENKAPSRARQHLKQGDVLVSMTRPNLNAVAILDAQYPTPIASTGFDVLRADQPTNSWLFSHVRSKQFVDVMTEKVQGALYPAIKSADVRSYPISLPPAKEQKRIVAKLEKCETRIDATREALSDVPELLEHYRQSVLAAAFRGDLTSEWRTQHSDSEPAEQLLERLRDERRKRWEQAELEKYEAKDKAPPKKWKDRYKAPLPLTDDQLKELPNLPKGWCWASPQELASEDKYALSIGPFGSNLKTSDYRDSGMPLIFVRDIRAEFDKAKVTKYVTPKKGAELIAHQICGGDLLITKMGDPPGDISRYPIESPDAIITADCIKLRIHKAIGDPDFFKWAIRSSTVQKHIKSIAKGVAQQKVSLARFATTPIPVAPIKEQIELLQILATIEARMKAMESLASDATLTLDTLTQSLLAKAFRGELVPQDPNDEPASKLLERIAEERDETNAKPRKRAKNK